MESRFSVLLIEGEQGLCRRLSAMLGGAGYRVDCVEVGEKPLVAVQRLAPDAVILEIGAAEAEGMQVLRRLLSNRANRGLPVIVISSEAALEYELLDAFDFLALPLDEQRLLEDLALLEQRRNSGALQARLPLDEEALGLFQDYLHRHSGLHFDQRNIRVLERGLQRRMRALGIDSYLGYFSYLERYGEIRRELAKLLGLLTIGETYFFRYLPHFEALVSQLIPEAITRNRASRTLRIWSAGCSSGEEAYTLALVLAENFPQLADWDVQILATDINKQVLKKAREGLFSARSVRLAEPRMLKRYFRPEGKSFRLEAAIRERVQFGYLNLQTDSYPDALDMAFCRNVMIYFRPETTRQIVARLARCLRPEGYLFLGHAETLLGISDEFVRIARSGGFLYQLSPKQAEPARSAPVEPPAARTPVQAVVPVANPQPAETPPSGPMEVYRQAMNAFDREEFGAALSGFEGLLAQEPGHVGALVGKGFVLANQARYDEALDCCSKALDEDDLCAEAYFLRGMIYQIHEEQEQALEEYRKALLLDMDFIMPHYQLGRIFARAGRDREARRELRNVLGLLEKMPEESAVPHSGGLSREVFLEVCREDLQSLETGEL